MGTIIQYTLIIVGVSALAVVVRLAVGLNKIFKRTTIPNSHGICPKCKAEQLEKAEIKWPKEN